MKIYGIEVPFTVHFEADTLDNSWRRIRCNRCGWYPEELTPSNCSDALQGLLSGSVRKAILFHADRCRGDKE